MKTRAYSVVFGCLLNGYWTVRFHQRSANALLSFEECERIGPMTCSMFVRLFATEHSTAEQ